jgi:hypothetical protein
MQRDRAQADGQQRQETSSRPIPFSSSMDDNVSQPGSWTSLTAEIEPEKVDLVLPRPEHRHKMMLRYLFLANASPGPELFGCRGVFSTS